MNDTPSFIAQKQFDIIYAKPVLERFKILDDMVNFTRQQTVNRITARLPNLTQNQLKYEIIKEYYGQEIGDLQLKEIHDALCE